jgi:dynein heavy chain
VDLVFFKYLKANIEPVYQFSLEFYIDLFERSVEKAIPGRFERVKNINNMFTQTLFQNIIRSLLEKDKLTFSILITVRIMQEEKKIITPQEVRFLMVGGTAISAKRPNPSDGWLTEK